MADEDVAWPSYVDFLSAFVFILLLFLGSTVFVVSGAIEEHEAERKAGQFVNGSGHGEIPWVQRGSKVQLILDEKLQFGRPGEYELTQQAKAHLEQVGRNIAASQDIERIVIEGYADKLQFQSDPFGNWKLSVDRALAVLRFLYSCTNCGYDPATIRPLLVLRGEGDVDAKPLLTKDEHRFGRTADRRVEIVLDFLGDNKKRR